MDGHLETGGFRLQTARVIKEGDLDPLVNGRMFTRMIIWKTNSAEQATEQAWEERFAMESPGEREQVPVRLFRKGKRRPSPGLS